MKCSIKVHSPAGLRGVDLLDTAIYLLLLASVQVSQSPGIRSRTSHLFLFSRDGRRLLAELMASIQIEVLPCEGGKGGPYGMQSKERTGRVAVSAGAPQILD